MDVNVDMGVNVDVDVDVDIGRWVDVDVNRAGRSEMGRDGVRWGGARQGTLASCQSGVGSERHSFSMSGRAQAAAHHSPLAVARPA